MFRASLFAVLASILVLHAKAIAQPAAADSEEIKPGDTIILLDAAELRRGRRSSPNCRRGLSSG